MFKKSASYQTRLYKYNQIKRLHLYARQKVEHECKKNITECAIAWDLVHDYEQAMRKFEKESDPLEILCEKNVEANLDECRIYE